MHLTELLALRPVPASVVFVTVTRRCPLSCAHCSTRSDMSSPEYAGDDFIRFVDSFTEADHPAVLAITGGEPMLRPRLVLDLAERAHAVGTRVCVISGMFFARTPGIPRPIREAIDAVDHFTASLDAFHEQEVSRTAVFDALGELVADGKDVSLQVVGLGGDDPYLADVTADIRTAFDGRVPALIGAVGAVGRAASWIEAGAQASVGEDPDGCDIAGWPVIAADGTILACCNQAVIDGPAPPHLRLGHAAHDDWSAVRQRCLESSLLRALRLVGPEYIAKRYGSTVKCDGYCSTCMQLSSDAELERRVEAMVERRTTQELERLVIEAHRRAGAVAFARQNGVARYADLVTLGAAGEELPSVA